MNSPEEWREVERLFHEALELPLPERTRLLDTVDTAVRKEVESLLRLDSTESLSASPARLASDLLDSQSATLVPGQHVGSYRVESLISIGGMGEVYLARDSSERPIALKILRRHLCHNGQAASRFETEARAASALHHPNIVTVEKSGDSPAGLFIAMEWLGGNTFRELIGSKVVSVAEAIDWGGQAAGALQAAHAAGILHRDIKPENMILCRDGVVKILDFGLASVAGLLRPESFSFGASGTISGTLSGTLLFMSPEILRGEMATSASDVFSLGAVLYELVTGRHPFAGDTPLDIFEAIERRSVVAPSLLRSGIPARVETLMLGMLDRNPTLRPSAEQASEILSKASART